jgi:hypothetical protein
MAINLIGSSYNSSLGSGDSYTLHTGYKRYLLVLAHNADVYDYYNPLVFGGETMTKHEDTGLGAAYNARVQIWGLVIPDSWSGSKSFSGTTVEGGGARASIVELSGVDPNDPKMESGSERRSPTNSTTNSVADLSCKIRGYVVDVIQLNADPGGLTSSANQTDLYNSSGRALSRYTTPTEGNVTMSWTHNQGSGDMAAISLRPYVFSHGGVTWIG